MCIQALAVEPVSATGFLRSTLTEQIALAYLKVKNTKYSQGSVINHVLMHQTVIGQETTEQMGVAEDYPDHIYGCVCYGCSFAGLIEPF